MNDIDTLVLVVCLCACSLVIGMGAAQPPTPECEPGTVFSVRKPDGTLDCYYERTDWRKKLEKRRKG